MLDSQLEVKSLLVTYVWYSTMSAVDCCYRDRVANDNTCDQLIDNISEYMDCQVAVYLYYSLNILCTWNRKFCAIILYMYVAPNYQLAWFEMGLKWPVSSRLTLG